MFYVIRYYTNILYTRLQRKYLIKYDSHTYSPYYLIDRKYAGTTVHKPQDANKWLKDAIDSGKPFMCAGFGSTEMYNLEVFDQKIQRKYDNAIKMLCNSSGFFPESFEMGERFANTMLDACKEVDMLGILSLEDE